MADPAGAALPPLHTLRDTLRLAVSRFNQAGLYFGHGQADAFAEASFLVLRALGLPLEHMELFLDATLSTSEIAALLQLIERRSVARLPAAYLLNEAWLQGYRFYVDPRCIIPRSFIAELLQDGLAPWVEPPDALQRVLDLCTGSGCLAILAAQVFAQTQVDALDLSPAALEVAARNVADYALGDRVRLLSSDLYAAVADQRYDLILSNPPYVTDAAMARLPAEYRHEPRLALAGGADGLDLVRRIVRGARARLRPGGFLLVEVGDGRAAVERCFPELALTWLSTSAGDDMVLLARYADLPV